MTNEIDLLDALITQTEALPFGDRVARDALTKRAKMYLRNLLGEDNEYVADVSRIRFNVYYAPSSPHEDRNAWAQGRATLINLIRTVKEERQLFGRSPAPEATVPASPSSVFIVHGHDEELKQSVARTVEKLGLNAIILHEQPNHGRTIIEKFSDSSNVAFAIVLLTADDVARSKDGDSESFRARQNVIFELGFFLGRLGRKNVASICKLHEHFELPSDYGGVLFIEYDPGGAWRFKLAKELKACGFSVNTEAIL